MLFLQVDRVAGGARRPGGQRAAPGDRHLVVIDGVVKNVFQVLPFRLGEAAAAARGDVAEDGAADEAAEAADNGADNRSRRTEETAEQTETDTAGKAAQEPADAGPQQRAMQHRRAVPHR